VLADNNLGMLTTIKHELLVYKANEATKVYEAVVQIAPSAGDFP
jgi:hypothetical protein